jgi:hypothetical protein
MDSRVQDTNGRSHKVSQQEQVEGASSRANAKATELYHFGKMGSISNINKYWQFLLPHEHNHWMS